MTEPSAPDDVVTIERVVDAPVQLVWRAWTEPEHFQAWFGPHGVSVEVAKMDVRVGGERLVSMAMTTPDGPMTMWFTGEFVEVVEPELLVYTDLRAHPDGRPMTEEELGDGHPTSTEVRVQLTDIGGRTGLTLTHVGIPADSAGAAGWNMALDKLTEYVDSADPA